MRKGARTGGLIGGIGGAIAGGTALSVPSTYVDDLGDTKQIPIGDRVTRGIVGAGVGGYFGHGIGRFGGAVTNAHRWGNESRPTVVRPDWLKKAKTKAQAKAAFRAQAKKMHPDHGGDPSAFRKMHDEWKEHEPTFKTAMLAAFHDEIEKISAVGAILGGMAGYKLGPNTMKGKVVGTLMGAGMGHVVERAGAAAKRGLVDEPHEREMRELYGYQPSVGYSY